MECNTLARFVAIATLLLSSGPRFSMGDENEQLEQSRIAWNSILGKECNAGADERAVRKFMEGKHRDVGVIGTNDEAHRLLYLIDDYHQIEFCFDRDRKLIRTPTIEPKGLWLRLPNGQVLSNLNPAEAKMKSKAEQVALQYVVEHTDHDRNSLAVFSMRSTKASNWDVVVTINSVQVDTPNYILEITDDGKVKETRPIEKSKTR